jgi:flagellar biosynthetic protein FlhB
VAEGNEDRDQKTEDATPRRREDARDKGQVALSQQLVAALMLCAGCAGLLLVGGQLAGASAGLVRETSEQLGALGTGELSPSSAASLLARAVQVVGPGLAGVILPVLAIGLLTALGQVGLHLSGAAVQPDLNKLSPAKNLRNVLGPRGAMRVGSGLLNIAIVASVMYFAVRRELPAILPTAGEELGPVLAVLGGSVLRALSAALAAIVVLALFDAWFKRWQHERELRMTKQEIKEEHKSAEGDPQVKARVRSIQREMARRRMMSDVPKATVVVTNPTHVSVALSYARDAHGVPLASAPRVVAKGVDEVARRIRELAAQHGVVCYEHVPLARALHAQVEIGQEIPEGLYAAVAEVLNYVYRLQGERIAQGPRTQEERATQGARPEGERATQSASAQGKRGAQAAAVHA